MWKRSEAQEKAFQFKCRGLAVAEVLAMLGIDYARAVVLLPYDQWTNLKMQAMSYTFMPVEDITGKEFKLHGVTYRREPPVPKPDEPLPLEPYVAA